MRMTSIVFVCRVILWVLIGLALCISFIWRSQPDLYRERNKTTREPKRIVRQIAPTIPSPPIMVRVYIKEQRKIEMVPLEKYVRGVVAAEMPLQFELEALKAQAIAARTYMIRRLQLQAKKGMPTKGDITNTVAHQAYKPLQQIKRLPQAAIEKLNQAIAETSDVVMTYQGKPIMAAFFSTSNGYTENAEECWGTPIPYLKSVASPWDRALSPRYVKHTPIKVKTLLSKLRRSSPKMRDQFKIAQPMLASVINKRICILNYTAGKRVKQVQVGTASFTGRKIRELFGLASTAFHWKIEGDQFIITTYGYGHGVGMSQYGAQGMAKRGASAKQIVTYYYKGIQFAQAHKIIRQRK